MQNRTMVLSNDSSIPSRLVRAVAAACAAAAIFAATPARAQDGTARVESETTSLEIFATHYWLDDQGTGTRPELGGAGARLMTNLGRVTRSNNTWFTRSSLGVFGVYTAKQKDNDSTSWHVGGELDAVLLPSPVATVLDPFLSVGAGAFHTRLKVGTLLGGEETVTNTDFALTPGAGTYFHFTPNISLRGDLRDVIIFGDETTHNFEASAGISLNF